MKLITQILHKHRTDLGKAYDAYHNHAQRVYHYATIFLLVRESKKMAIAAAYHDLGIWTGKSMNYLPGSVKLATAYLSQSEYGLLPDEMRFIITNHHKLRPVKGNIEAEAFRKGDLTDLTCGHIRYNLPESIITEAERKFPRLHFTKMMLRKTLKGALKHPMKPLPMIRW